MRLRVCIILAALAGAVASLALAADIYRRISSADHAAASANTVFGTAHMLGNAGISVLLLGIAILAVVETKKPAAPAANLDLTPAQTLDSIPTAVTEIPVTEFPTVATDEVSPATPLENSQPAMGEPVPAPVVDSLPAASFVPAAPKVPDRSARNIYVVQAPPAPAQAIQDDRIGTPIPLTDTEFQRAVVFETTLREQGEVPDGTPADGESRIAEAALGDDGNDAKLNAQKP